MERKFFKNQVAVIKILFFCLALLLSGVLFVSGSMAAENCRPSTQYSIAPFGVNSTLCNACYNTEHSNNNCRNQCSLPIELPKTAAVSNGGVQSGNFLFAAAHVKVSGWIPDPEPNTYIISTEINFRSPPIFLQNESFLI